MACARAWVIRGAGGRAASIDTRTSNCAKAQPARDINARRCPVRRRRTYQRTALRSSLQEVAMSSFLVFPASNRPTRASTLRVLIAEPSRALRRTLANAVHNDARFTLVAEATNGGEALNMLEQQAPDVAFLPLQMPRLSGTEVVEALGQPASFTVVWTAARRHAGMRSITTRAADQLDLPAEASRLARALDRAFADCRERAPASATAEGARPCVSDELTVKTLEGRWSTLSIAQIERITAAAGYVNIITSAGIIHRVRTTLRALASRLGPVFVWRGRGELVSLRVGGRALRLCPAV
jgi:two-component system, LytTR family, response regulator